MLPILRLVAAASIAAGTIAVQLLLWRFIDPYAWLMPIVAVFAAAFLTGTYGGLIATVISDFSVLYFFLPPRLSWSLEKHNDLYAILVFAGIGVGISLISKRMRSLMLRQAAHEVDAQWKRALDQSADAVFITNKTGRFLYTNSSAIALLGYTSTELAQLSIQDVVPTEERETALRSFKVSQRVGYVRAERNLRTKDGAVIPIELHATSLADGNFFGSCRDISETLRSRTALEQNELKFRRAIENAPIPVMIHAEDGEIVMISRAWTEIAGYTHADIPTISDWTEKGFGQRSESAKSYIDKLYELGARIDEGEWVIHTKDGAQRIWEFGSAPLGRESDGRRLVISMAMDITESRIARDALIASEETYRSLFNSTEIAMFRSRLDGSEALNVNEKFLELVGLIRAEVIGRPTLNYWVDPQRREELVRRARNDGPVIDFECKMRNSTRGVRDCLLSLNLYAEEGVIVGSILDITERKKAEDDRAVLEGQLRESQKMEALGTLAGGVAHDFNNVLATIIGNVELARQDVGTHHPALVSLDEIGNASLRARDLVQQILAFGRRQTMEPKPTSLALIVVESARLIRATLPTTVTLDVVCKPDAPAVLADATQAKQVLLNLCGNALQAVQGEGRAGVIQIQLDSHTQNQIKGILQPGRYARLIVRDNGCGMNEEIRSRIFEPFFTTKPRGKGTGLGLSVVYGIVQTHKGVLEVVSSPGQGSEFCIYFPAIDVPTIDNATLPARPSPLQGEGQRILYIDDEEAIVFLMKRLLERKGYRVQGFTDPKEALAVMRADPTRFDLVVTDYSMPGMSGLEVAASLRDIRADLPVVLASGYVTEGLRRKAPTVGIYELIYKPNTVDDLCEAVARVATLQKANFPS